MTSNEHPPIPSEFMKRLKEDSNSIVDNCPLVSLLYSLLRDGDVAPGRLFALVGEIATTGPIETRYTNGFIAQYAQWLAAELEKSKP